ncbi:MAG: hypothetical protein R6V62_03940 [Candidatus Fermentibacteraceae bacterium]
MTVAVAAILMVLTLAALMYFRGSASSLMFQQNRLRAMYAAESGVNLALHCLKEMEELPSQRFDPFTESIGIADGSSSFSVTVVPLGAGRSTVLNGAVEIHSVGSHRTQEYRFVVRAVPRYLSGFALLVDGDIPQGFFSDGAVIDGPVHANGTIHFDSTTPDSTDDPRVSSISTTRDGGFVFSDVGAATEPHPTGSRVWVMPWLTHRQGRPTWTAAQDPVDMNRVVMELSEAARSGTNIHATRVLLDGDRIIYRADISSSPDTLPLEGIHIITVYGGYHGVTIKSLRRLTSPLTVFTSGDLVIGGPIDGGLAGLGGPLGLVSQRDIIIETDPDLTGQEDWEPPWQIETNTSFVVRAFLAAPAGRLRARDNHVLPTQTRFSIHGGLAVSSFSWSRNNTTGYSLGIAMDQGLSTFHPPGFPQVWKWTPVSWQMDSPQDASRD